VLRSGALRYLHSFPTRRSSDLSRTGRRGVVDAFVGSPVLVQRMLAHAEARAHPGKSERRAQKRLAQVPSLGGVVALAEIHGAIRSEEHTSELQSRRDLVCRLLL